MINEWHSRFGLCVLEIAGACIYRQKQPNGWAFEYRYNVDGWGDFPTLDDARKSLT